MKKNIEPCGIDLHFKYSCPHCQNIEWLSLAEVKTKNYVCVCQMCEQTFSPKRIADINIKYTDQTEPTKKKSKKVKVKKAQAQVQIPETTHVNGLSTEILDGCVNALKNYGFTTTESRNGILTSFNKLQTQDTSSLMNDFLKTFAQK